MSFLTAVESQRAIALAGYLCKQGDLGKEAVIQPHDLEIVAFVISVVVILSGHHIPEAHSDMPPG